MPDCAALLERYTVLTGQLLLACQGPDWATLEPLLTARNAVEEQWLAEAASQAPSLQEQVRLRECADQLRQAMALLEGQRDELLRGLDDVEQERRQLKQLNLNLNRLDSAYR
ncbi:hypothetical protein QU481_13175 [Crenobacter sp. SG2303]|uniref:Flagellar protein FliT n=1 Tax=Crenobacter oryzisoli TaxID=3056844 RepID=A0ABT7XPW9_9NEIS|nr:hypothetical protein [Crenobacter sp. SG2303]MDN0075839.1 hypothetical protein [Crenobacter sp. SG2303]